MESQPIKRQKFCENTSTSSVAYTLEKVADPRESRAIAVKYFKLDGSCRKIDYEQLCAESRAISTVLRDANCSQFVGIAFDIPAYCLTSLMLGITSSGRAFAYLPSSVRESKRIAEKLRISHFFSPDESEPPKIGKSLCVHYEKMFFLQTQVGLDSVGTFSSNGECESAFAYAATTSGSTGEPKIVKVTHASISRNIVDLKRILNLTERDAVAQTTPLTFDPSIIEIFLSLSCRGTLLTFSKDLKNDPEMLLKTLVDNSATFLQTTPSLLLQRWSCDDLAKSLLGDDASLKYLLLGGEDFPSDGVLSKIRSRENATRIFDVYGITEVSCWSGISEFRGSDFSRKLGEPLSETIYEVRNDKGEKLVEGEGILHIGSDSRICVIDDENIDELNVPVFRDTGDVVQIDKNGEMKLKGRRDRCVKRYGTKLYLRKLESHVRQLSFVRDCYVIFDRNNQSLHLFFTIFEEKIGNDDRAKYENEVLARTKKLTSIERPDVVALLNRFELTINGKICENHLRKMSAKLREMKLENREELETLEIFENIWKRSMTNHEEASGFLDSGGTSVIAIRVVDEFCERVARRFPKLAGLLLGNANLRVCREYISAEASSVSREKEKTPFDAYEMSERFFNEEKHRFSEKSRKQPENVILPWQKCRGRSNFPNFEKSGEKRSGNELTIRRESRYDLGKCVDASPTVFKYPGGESYVTVGSHAGIICTAELRGGNSGDSWRVCLPDRIEASVLVIHDFRGIVGSYDTFLYCVHLKSGEVFWKFKTSDVVKCTAVLSSNGENVFFGSYDRKAYCVSLRDGSPVWSRKISAAGICATPCTSRELNSVVFATLGGVCVSLKQNNGEVNWSINSNYPIFSGPRISSAETVAFCDVSGNLNFVSAASGEKIWQEKIAGNVFSHLCVRADEERGLDEIVFASENKFLYKMEFPVEGRRPTFRFAREIPGPSTSTPFSDGRFIVAATNDGRLTFFRSENGEPAGHFRLDGHVFSSPLIHDDLVVVGCRDDHLHVLSMRGKDSER